MRKLVLVMILMRAAAGIFAQDGKTADDKPVARGEIIPDGLNMRVTASSDADVVKTLYKGNTVTIYGDLDAAWLLVEHEGKRGYASAKFIAVSPLEDREQAAADIAPPGAERSEPADLAIFAGMDALALVDLAILIAWLVILGISVKKKVELFENVPRSLIIGAVGAVLVFIVFLVARPARALFQDAAFVHLGQDFPAAASFMMGDIESEWQHAGSFDSAVDGASGFFKPEYWTMQPYWFVSTAANVAVFVIGANLGALSGGIAGLLGYLAGLFFLGPTQQYGLLLSAVFGSMTGYFGGALFFSRKKTASIVMYILLGYSIVTFLVYFYIASYSDTIKEVIGFFVYKTDIPWMRLVYTAVKFISLGLLGLVENIVQFFFLWRLFAPSILISSVLMAIITPLCVKFLYDTYDFQDDWTPFSAIRGVITKYMKSAASGGIKFIQILEKIFVIVLGLGVIAMGIGGMMLVWGAAFDWWIKLLISIAIVLVGRALIGGVVKLDAALCYKISNLLYQTHSRLDSVVD